MGPQKVNFMETFVMYFLIDNSTPSLSVSHSVQSTQFSSNSSFTRTNPYQVVRVQQRDEKRVVRVPVRV